ncbi:hypothetical protein CRG98_013270 [Punica granatum]|uniref:Uncharacterized protein n=1 Tax=Punica granatum TaxID=22663 RepID=A0A2I0KCP0_PUNGR|nr:hypothetical protein CRG98_013270 [Punica granatum]
MWRLLLTRVRHASLGRWTLPSRAIQKRACRPRRESTFGRAFGCTSRAFGSAGVRGRCTGRSLGTSRDVGARKRTRACVQLGVRRARDSAGARAGNV